MILKDSYLSCESQDELIARAYSDIIEAMFAGEAENIDAINEWVCVICNDRGWDFISTLSGGKNECSH